MSKINSKWWLKHTLNMDIHNQVQLGSVENLSYATAYI